MEWSRLDVAGRVTSLGRGHAAGVDEDGNAFVVPMRLPHSAARTYDGLMLDSFGVLGVAHGEHTWITGRGADGRLHLWSAYDDGSMFVPHSLEAVEAVWATPVLDAYAELVLTAHLDGGSWRLRVFPREAAILGGKALAADLVMGTDPDTALAYAFHEREPLVVAGPLGDSGTPRAWSLAPDDAEWRRIHLASKPDALCSVGTGQDGRHTWVAGHLEGRAVIHQVLPLPFRGLLRSAEVDVPPLALAEDALGVGDRPRGLVDQHERDLPVFVAALARGNRLCWHDGIEWKAHPAPEGRIRAACAAAGAVHVLVDGVVWSLPDPS
jgi:hypothetical protein